MFTGLIEDVGTIDSVDRTGGGLALAVRTAIPLVEVRPGDSIAVDGVCLTAERTSGDRFYAIAGRETLARSTLGDARPGQRVHLERALPLGGRLGGHLVQGHVDAVGRLVGRTDAAESIVLEVEAPRPSMRYIVEKGSICLSGVSLTVNDVGGCRFRVNVVPHTARSTRLGALRLGEVVNVEVDVLAKYVEALLAGGKAGGTLTLETLARSGFSR